jgi:FYVE, RhoGEF and PH domain containing 5/6
MLSSSPSRRVDFPLHVAGGSSSHGDASALALTQRPPHLPFRRISFPSAPGLVKRHSVTSVLSVESTPEEPPQRPLIIRRVSAKTRPVDVHERRKSATRLRPINEAREAKRRKIVAEFYETERTYVDGLNLVYEVCSTYYHLLLSIFR